MVALYELSVDHENSNDRETDFAFIYVFKPELIHILIPADITMLIGMIPIYVKLTKYLLCR